MSKMKTKLVLLGLSLGLLGLTPFLSATTYYVAASGNDGYNGLAAAFTGGANGPFRTIGHAAAAVKPGDSVFIRGGTYAEQVTFAVHGTASARITIDNYADEKVVIDGGYVLPASYSNPLVHVYGHYTTLRDVTITRAAGGLCFVSGDWSELLNIEGRGSWCSGIVATGDHNLIDGCSMTDNGNGYQTHAPTWGSAIATTGSNTIIQNCVSHDNRGEGLNAYDTATYAVIQDCVSYDNVSLNCYVDSSNHVTVRRNLLYHTAPTQTVAFYVGNEYGHAVSDIAIYNNLILGSRTNLVVAANVTNLRISNNEFVNACGQTDIGYNMGVLFRDFTFSGCEFRNNIIVQDSSAMIPATVKDRAGWTFSNNGWNKTPSSAAAGAGDVVGDPLLEKTGTMGPGTLAATWFSIQEGSPLRDRGEALSDVPDDFLLNPRGSTPDIGAFELAADGEPLTASAAAVPASGQAPLAVTFTARPSGGAAPYTYLWTFGDGGSSTAQNPSHTYASPGSYLATVTVVDSNRATADATVPITAAMSVPLGASASAGATSGTAPLAVSFTGAASGGRSPYAYRWTFGDGTSSTSQSPSHTYASAGVFTATLTVTDGDSATAQSSVLITVTTPLSAAASASPASGPAPLAVSFSGAAAGGRAPYAYRWTFGDGGTSTSQNPSHTYASAGNFTATLTVTDAASATAASSAAVYAAAASPLSADIIATPKSGTAPLNVAFASGVIGGKAPYAYAWAFGDGGTSTSQNATHTYRSAGVFAVTLTTRDGASGVVTSTTTITVTAAPAPLAVAASASTSSGYAPLGVSFSAAASGGRAPYTYGWSFGDGTSSASRSPVHTYSRSGVFRATVIVTDMALKTTSSTAVITVAETLALSAGIGVSLTSARAPATASFTGSASGGAPPYTFQWSFGDGAASTLQNPSHTYRSDGGYIVRLTVKDSHGASVGDSTKIVLGDGSKDGKRPPRGKPSFKPKIY